MDAQDHLRCPCLHCHKVLFQVNKLIFCAERQKISGRSQGVCLCYNVIFNIGRKHLRISLLVGIFYNCLSFHRPTCGKSSQHKS